MRPRHTRTRGTRLLAWIEDQVRLRLLGSGPRVYILEEAQPHTNWGDNREREQKGLETIRRLRKEGAYCYLKCEKILFYSMSQEG